MISNYLQQRTKALINVTDLADMDKSPKNPSKQNKNHTEGQHPDYLDMDSPVKIKVNIEDFNKKEMEQLEQIEKINLRLFLEEAKKKGTKQVMEEYLKHINLDQVDTVMDYFLENDQKIIRLEEKKNIYRNENVGDN